MYVCMYFENRHYLPKKVIRNGTNKTIPTVLLIPPTNLPWIQSLRPLVSQSVSDSELQFQVHNNWMKWWWSEWRSDAVHVNKTRILAPPLDSFIPHSVIAKNAVAVSIVKSLSIIIIWHLTEHQQTRRQTDRRADIYSVTLTQCNSGKYNYADMLHAHFCSIAADLFYSFVIVIAAAGGGGEVDWSPWKVYKIKWFFSLLCIPFRLFVLQRNGKSLWYDPKICNMYTYCGNFG